MFWGIGIEHEMMMVDKHTYYIDGALLCKGLNLELYSDETKSRIKKFINKKSNYEVFSSISPNVYVRLFKQILDQFIKDSEDKVGKYIKINDLFSEYVKLYSGKNKTKSDIINKELFESIADDLSITTSVPEFITPISLITNNISSVCREMILKEQIVEELHNLKNIDIVYPKFGYILPIDSDNIGKEELKEQLEEGIECPRLEMDYTGSYHFNLTLPYDNLLIDEEERKYYALCNEVDEYIDDILDNMSFNDGRKALTERITIWSEKSISNLFLSRIGGITTYNKIFPISLDKITEKEKKEKTKIKDNMELINDLCTVYRRSEPAKIFEHIYAEYVSEMSPGGGTPINRLKLYLNFNNKLYPLENLYNPKLRANLRSLHVLTKEIAKRNIAMRPQFKYFIRFTVNKNTDGKLIVTPHCSFIMRNYITHEADFSIIDRQFHKSTEMIKYGGPTWAQSSSKLKVIFDKHNYDKNTNYNDIALNILYLTDIVVKQIVRKSTFYILEDVLDFYKLHIKYTKIDFCRIHHEWACAIQWFSPLLLSAFSSCDPFSIGDNNKLSELSFRIFISGYNFVNMTNIRDLMLPTGSDTANDARITSKYQKKSRLEKNVVNTFGYDYDKITDQRKGEDRLHVANEFRVDTSKGFKFGFELRLFDHFPSIHCEVLLEFLFLLAEFIHDKTHSKESRLPEGNPYDNLNYDKDILKILSQGWNQPFPKNYENFLVKNFGLEISNKCRFSRGGSRPYVYDVINDLYEQLQINYIDTEGRGKGIYVSHLILRNKEAHRENTINILPNINRCSWTTAFNQFVWNLEPKTRKRIKIEKILDKLKAKKKIHVGYLRKLLKENLHKLYDMDIDDIIYALEDLNELKDITIKGVYYYNNELRLP